ncbi:MAG TPA: SlyX family protein [Steroidobacteraceae bacterium]|jgi:SlyX protein
MNDSSLEQIEVKIAFLEQAHDELSDVVLRQQREIDALRAQIAALIDRMEAAQAKPDVLTPEQERPPHY